MLFALYIVGSSARVEVVRDRSSMADPESIDLLVLNKGSDDQLVSENQNKTYILLSMSKSKLVSGKSRRKLRMCLP